MNVKTTFLIKFLNEEVFVEQNPRFEDASQAHHVYKLDKALYGFKETLRALYDRLSQFLLSKGYKCEEAHKTFFPLKEDDHILLVQIYVDDIIFGSTNLALVTSFEKLVTSEFEKSMIDRGAQILPRAPCNTR